VQLKGDDQAIKLQRDELAQNQSLANEGFVSKARLLVLQREAARYESGAAINLTNTSPDGVPAVVLLHGGNGYGATNFFSRARTTNAAVAGGEFDDIVAWISRRVPLYRTFAAGKLP